MLDKFNFIVRDLVKNEGYSFSVTSASLNNALASLEIQYNATGNDYNTCEIMSLQIETGVDIEPPEYPNP